MEVRTKTGLELMREIQGNLVFTVCDYAIQSGMCTDEDAYEILCESESAKEFDHIQKILAAQVAIFTMRRINGAWGECIDALRDISAQLKFEYKEKFGKEYNDINYNANW